MPQFMALSIRESKQITVTNRYLHNVMLYTLAGSEFESLT